MGNHQVGDAQRAPFWLPPDTSGWELVPGPDACWCGMPACRSGWEWRPTGATPEAALGGPGKALDVEQPAAGWATEPDAPEIGSDSPQPAGQDAAGWQTGAAERGPGRRTGAAEMEREA
jgi:hypothetical protein